MFRVNFPGKWERRTCDYILLNTYYCMLFMVAGYRGIGLDVASGWLVVMHAYLYHFPLSGVTVR